VLSQHDYYISRVDKHKIYLDKVYTTSEWLTMEKRRMDNELKRLSSTYVDLSTFTNFKKMTEKDHIITKNRIFGLEQEFRKTDNYIDKRVPIETVKLVASLLEEVFVKKKSVIREAANGMLREMYERLKGNNGTWSQLEKDWEEVGKNSL
jgi:hypothetical protein